MNFKKKALILVFFLILIPSVFGYKDDLFCTRNTTCEIGFYTLNASNVTETFPYANCSITIVNSTNAEIVSGAQMLNHSDGWQNYSFSTNNEDNYRYLSTCAVGEEVGSEYGEILVQNSLTTNILNSTSNATATVNTTAVAEAVWNTNLNGYNSSGTAGNAMKGQSGSVYIAVILGLLLITGLFAVLGLNYDEGERQLFKPFFMMLSLLMTLVTIWMTRLIVQVNASDATDILTLLDTTYWTTLWIVITNSMFYTIIVLKNVMVEPYKWLINWRNKRF